MDSATFLPPLRRDLQAFETCLENDLTVPIEHCGAWTLHDLAGHLGNGNLWSATAVTEKRGDHEAVPVPEEPAHLIRWFHETSETLLTALESDSSTEAWTLFPPRTVEFWRRRRCLETVIHLWDAEHALGNPRPLDPWLAAEGVSEVIDTIFPRQIDLSRAAPPDRAIRLTATDSTQTWTLGPGTPVATIRGTAQSLYLLLWARIPAESPDLTWEGDQASGRQVLARPITP